MDPEKLYACTAALTAQLLNLGYITADEPKTVQFMKVQSLLMDFMRIQNVELKEIILTPSDN